MDHTEFNNSEDTKSLPGTQSTESAELNIQNTSRDDLSVKGSICKMGMSKLTVKDYLSSLQTYMETPPSIRWDGATKTAPCAPISISEMIKLCEADPVDLLIDLGFGIDEPDICTKIPSRFIMTPSEAKGINTRVFLEAQKKRMEIENPNLCGRFRQLEVLEQVTSAFSSLLNDVHTIQKGENQNVNSVRKSTLTQEKRKTIRQLLWKFSRQVKIVDENPSPCINKTESNENRDHHEPLKETSNLKVFRKRRYSTEVRSLADLSKAQLPAEDNGDALNQRQEAQLCTLSTPVKQYKLPEMAGKINLKGSKVLSKTLKKTSVQHSLQPPDSFEMEEVQSFEEDYPRAIYHDSISEMTRTNSCQSDSSGFQEEPPELLPLQNLHESSDSTDSQSTLREKNYSTVYKDDSEEYDDSHFTAPFKTYENLVMTSRSCGLQKNQEKCMALSMNTEHTDDVFQSFKSHTNNVDKENMEGQLSDQGVTDNEAEKIIDGASYLEQCEQEEQINHQQINTSEESSEVDFPIYVTHYLSDIIESNCESSGEIHDSQMPDFSERCVSDLRKSDSERGSFADDECSVELSNVKWAPSPMSDSQSFSFHTRTPVGSIDYSDEELSHCYQDKKNTFQTEINTNIYKSVTIQMSSALLPDTGNCLNRHHCVYNTNTNSEERAMLNCNAERKEAFSQTDMGWWNECRTNNHCSHQRSFLTESLSFDTGLWGLHHSHHPALSTHYCHCCHCHHCCVPRCPTMYRHNVSMRPTATQVNIEKELSDTLKLLRESLINMSLNTDHGMENLKKSCQKYREKLVEIEQRLIEQQAGCFNIFTGEEREKIRTLHLLRRKVLKEAIELEFNLDGRARHVKETISMQLEQLLEEQSRLYSELEFCNWQQDTERYGNLHKTHSFPSTSSSTFSVPKEDPCLKINQAEPDQENIQKLQQLLKIK